MLGRNVKEHGAGRSGAGANGRGGVSEGRGHHGVVSVAVRVVVGLVGVRRGRLDGAGRAGRVDGVHGHVGLGAAGQVERAERLREGRRRRRRRRRLRLGLGREEALDVFERLALGLGQEKVHEGQAQRAPRHVEPKGDVVAHRLQ